MGRARFTTGISEVALGVSDVRTATTFYSEVVGLPVEMVSDDFASLSVGEKGQSRRVILLSRGLPPLSERGGRDIDPGGDTEFGHWKPDELGRNHFALNVPGGRLAEALEHVRGCGVPVHGPIHFEWMKASAHYFFDPDGNLVEFWTPD